PRPRAAYPTMVVRGVVAARRRPCLMPGRQPQITRAARLLRPTQATAAHEAPVALVSARARRLSAPAGVRARPSPFPRTGGATLPCSLSRIAAVSHANPTTTRSARQGVNASNQRLVAPENRGGIEISHFLAAYQPLNHEAVAQLEGRLVQILVRAVGRFLVWQPTRVRHPIFSKYARVSALQERVPLGGMELADRHPAEEQVDEEPLAEPLRTHRLRSQSGSGSTVSGSRCPVLRRTSQFIRPRRELLRLVAQSVPESWTWSWRWWSWRWWSWRWWWSVAESWSWWRRWRWSWSAAEWSSWWSWSRWRWSWSGEGTWSWWR